MITYFVSYSWSLHAGKFAGFGNMSIHSDVPIDSVEDIDEIQNLIKEKIGYDESVIVVLNFQILKKDTKK